MSYCGAKTRSGQTCKKSKMDNGRCYMHGGASTGPKDKEKHRRSMKGNKNSLKTGEYEQIWFNTFSNEDINQYNIVPLEVMAQLEHELKLTDIRERRMMERIFIMQTSNKSIEDIQKVEEGLTRIQAVKLRLIEQKSRLIEEVNNPNENSSLEQFIDILAEARKKYSS